MIFNAKEWQRYQRHIQLGNFGAQGQARLKQSHVLIVGAGGLGCPAAQYLGAAGIGNITLVDADEVSRTNLQRQVLFTEQDIGQNKADVARRKLLDNNPYINVNVVEEHLNVSNAESLICSADLVVDCTDNFATRYLINDWCIHARKPWVYASVVQLSGQASLFTPDTACFRCLFPDTPKGVADCNSAGVMGTMPGLLALLQANEAIKYLAGLTTPLANNLMLVEGLSLDFRKIQLKKNTDCLCQKSHIEIDPANPDYEFVCEAAQPQSDHILSLEDFEQKRAKDNTQVIDVRSEAEHEGFNLGGMNVPLSEDYHRHFQDQEQTYLFYCQSGIRSLKAASQMQEKGFQKVFSLAGGISRHLDKL